MAQQSSLKNLLNSGRVTGFTPIGDAVIDDFEKRHNLRYSDSFRSFLKISNGLLLHGLTIDNSLLGDIRSVFGIGNSHPQADLEQEFRSGLGFYRADFLPFASIIGKGYEGSPVCEVSAGTRKGEIMFADHEVYHGMADEFHVAHRSPDDVISEFVESGWFNPIATSLDNLMDQLASAL